MEFFQISLSMKLKWKKRADYNFDRIQRKYWEQKLIPTAMAFPAKILIAIVAITKRNRMCEWQTIRFRRKGRESILLIHILGI